MKNIVWAVIASSCAAGMARAGTDVDNELGTLEAGLSDIVVTATRQSTMLQETPVAVTVITSGDIAEQNITTARDLAGKTPGVTIVRSGITPLTQVFFIRGIGESEPIFDPAIAQYVDDVYLPRAINGLSDLTDIERVEVLRGPQGTLFGDNAEAGAIRYITKDPTDQSAANVDIGSGNYGAFQTHAYVSGALVPGVLDGSVAFAHDQHDGYTYDPTIGKHVNDQNTNGFRAKLLAKFSDVLNRPKNVIRPQAYTDAFVSYAAPGGHSTASLTGHNLADRRDWQSLSFAGSKNSWEGPVSPPRTVFFKIGYVL